MLIIPQLQNMSVEDLNARYANSFVMYNGKVRWIAQFFGWTPGKPKVSWYDSPKSDEELEDFDARLLDVRRFPSMWVIDKDSFYFVQANMNVSQRYVRGIQDDTYSFWNLHYKEARYSNKVKILEACYKTMDKWEEQTFIPIKLEVLLSTKEGEIKVHSPMRNVLLMKQGTMPLGIYVQSRIIVRGTPLYERIQNECVEQ